MFSSAISAQFTVRRSRKLQKKHLSLLSLRIPGHSRSFKVIDVDTILKLVTSACYDKRHVCIYLQLFFLR